MTPEQFEETMATLKSCYHDDPEGFHVRADDLMCDLLRSLGFGGGIDIFKNAYKWYW